MPVTVSKNFGPLADLPLTTPALMREVGLLARERIVQRTRAGVDIHGSPFRPYSEAYRRRKDAELGATTVNLTVSGAMLNLIQIRDVTDTSVTLGWP